MPSVMTVTGGENARTEESGKQYYMCYLTCLVLKNGNRNIKYVIILE